MEFVKFVKFKEGILEFPNGENIKLSTKPPKTPNSIGKGYVVGGEYSMFFYFESITPGIGRNLKLDLDYCKEDLNDKTKSIEEYKKNYDECLADNDKIYKDFNEITESHNFKMNEFGKTIDSLKEMKKNLEDENSTLKDKMLNLRKVEIDLNRHISWQKEEISKSYKKQRDIKEENETLRDNVKTLKIQKNEIGKIRDDYLNKHNALEKKVEKCIKEKEKYKNQHTELNQKFKFLTEDYKKLENKSTFYLEKLKINNEKFNTLEKKLKKQKDIEFKLKEVTIEIEKKKEDYDLLYSDYNKLKKST